METFDMNAFISRVDNAIKDLQAMKMVLETHIESGKTKPRIITKMAKNIQCGDIIEYPDRPGRGEVIGFGRSGGEVGLTCRGDTTQTVTVKEDMRIRVVRES